MEALQRAGIAPKLAAYGANWSRKTASCRRLVGTRIIGSPDCIAGLAQYSVGRIHCFFCGGRRNGGVEVRWFCRGRVDPESCLPPNIYKEKVAWQEEGTQGPKLTFCDTKSLDCSLQVRASLGLGSGSVGWCGIVRRMHVYGEPKCADHPVRWGY